MPQFRGNVGNLLQHWVLCEVLEILARPARRLDFVDAYSMAPLAQERPRRDGTSHVFDAVQGRLPGERTAYERAWHTLASGAPHYPNSAQFVTNIWSGPCSLLLCESDASTAEQLSMWARSAATRRNVIAAGVWAGDWRVRFREGLRSLGELALLSFDPYMFDRNGSGRNAANMDPRDLDLLCEAVDATNADVFLQLSTYSANNNNPQSAVTEIVASALQRAGLHLLSCVRADGNMMSLVFARDLRYASEMEALPARFLSWLTAAKGASAREDLRRAR